MDGDELFNREAMLCRLLRFTTHAGTPDAECGASLGEDCSAERKRPLIPAHAIVFASQCVG